MARTVLALLTASLALPPAAFALPRVFVDPDSPAGQEYAIPLEEARRQVAAGAAVENHGPNGAGDSGRGQPLFGVGMGRADASSGSGRNAPGNGADAESAGVGESGGGERGDRVNQGNEDGDGSLGPETLAPDARSTAAIEAAASDGSSVLPTAGIAAGVLALGLLSGFGLQRLLRSE
jgi:hypothetical protein